MDNTKIYEKKEFGEELALEAIRQVYSNLKERGYDPINQIVGYLMSGDPGYITSYNGSRNLITSFDRTKLLEILIKNICDI